MYFYIFVDAPLYFTFFTANSFFFGNRGQADCPNGDFINDQAMCKNACTQLNVPHKEILGGFVCYKDGGGNCHQNGKNGGGASMVCKGNIPVLCV